MFFKFDRTVAGHLPTSCSFEIRVHDYRFSALVFWNLGGDVFDVSVNDESVNDDERNSLVPYGASSLDEVAAEVALAIIAIIRADGVCASSEQNRAIACVRHWLRDTQLDRYNKYHQPQYPFDHFASLFDNEDG